MKNHQLVNGKLLQTNKKYSHLKQRQQQKIAGWMYEETYAYYKTHQEFPKDRELPLIIDAVYDKISEADIWIPFGEVERHYKAKRSKIHSKIRKVEQGPNQNHEDNGNHKPEKVIFMNMCMVCDGDKVLALNKVGKYYSGITFPGGHVEHGEIYLDAVIREIYEETGLTIKNPILKGIYHWYRDGLHNVGLLYKATAFEGQLISSEEGEVYWIPLEEYRQLSLAHGMDKVLQIMENDTFTECFMDVHEDGTVTEHLR